MLLFSLYILIILHSQFTRYIKRVEVQIFNISDSLDKGSVPFVTLFAEHKPSFGPVSPPSMQMPFPFRPPKAHHPHPGVERHLEHWL